MTDNSEKLDPPERLGTVSAPSGILLVLDGGLLNLWRHDGPPTLPVGLLEGEAPADADNAVDFRLEGPDARAAGIKYDRCTHPLYFYDVPASHAAEREAHFAAFAKEQGFDASLVRLEERITHRERVDRHLADGVPGNGISFHGVWAAVVDGVPPGETFPVYGRRRATGTEFEGRWHDVYLELLPGAAVTRSEMRGYAGVDEARLIFADTNALGAWEHEDSLDGKADFAFWGADAVEAAEKVRAGRLDGGDNVFGWRGLPIAKAARHGRKVEKLRDKRGWRFATDFRPHSHHWQAMEQVRASETESGTVTVGGAEMCLFMTTWGDGIYEIFADYDAGDRLVRIRAALGTEQTLERMRAVQERYFGALSKMALATKRVLEDGQCVRFLYREKADREQDSGWRVFAGGETDNEANDPDNVVLVPLRELLERDKALEAIFREPVGSVFERENCGDEFVPVMDWSPVDDD